MPNTSRILLVDDELLVLDITKEFLSLNLEFSIDTATSAIEGLQKLKDGVYDAVVSDYEMPEMNGIQFLKEVRKTDDIPFILFTGRGREEVAIEAINFGANFYINKGGEPTT
ncbi:MAG: response regulator [Methanomassiliicoccales archaeon]|jgi:CheY-like chemotaxis protein